MLLRDTAVVLSASDIVAANKCEFGFLRGIDEKFGRVEHLEIDKDAMEERLAALGDAHEQRILKHYRQLYPGEVVVLSRPTLDDELSRADAIDQAAERTREVFANGNAKVICQPTIASYDFLGFADFAVRQDNGRYRLQDAKLARSVKAFALVQLAAYVDELTRQGVDVDSQVDVLLGNNVVESHSITDIIPVYRTRKRQLHALVEQHLGDSEPVAWGDDRYRICGSCKTCSAEIKRTGDLLQVAGMRRDQRQKLRRAGVQTLEDLANWNPKSPFGAIEKQSVPHNTVAGLSERILNKLRDQAELQLRTKQLSEDRLCEEKPADDQSSHDPSGGSLPGITVPVWKLLEETRLSSIPPKSDGDLFFDFEGDPLYQEQDGGTEQGLDYLFGVLDTKEHFTAFWAHSFSEEKQAFLDFLDFVDVRRQQFPDLHIYHYASYEKTHLSSLALRHSVGDDRVEQLINEGVLVDLYPIVTGSIRVGSDSYSIKKLEPLYMGENLRDGAVTNAADSIVAYAQAMDMLREDPCHGDALLQEIEDYNKYDVLSTLKLRNWLLSIGLDEDLAASSFSAVEIIPDTNNDRARREEGELFYEYRRTREKKLLELAGERPFSADRQAYALASAALFYHWRENRPRLRERALRQYGEPEEWLNQTDVVDFDNNITVEQLWEKRPKERKFRRSLRLTADPSIVSAFELGRDIELIYDSPVPFEVKEHEAQARVSSRAKVEEVSGNTVLVRETQKGKSTYTDLPMAAYIGDQMVSVKNLEQSIAEWCDTVVENSPGWPPKDPIGEILRRRVPRLSGGAGLDREGDDLIGQIYRSVVALDGSYLAVQGPPGTGKTYAGAHIIKKLVQNDHWRIGVVGQSHAVVENLLRGIVEAGLDPDLVGKKPQVGKSALETGNSDSGDFPYVRLDSRSKKNGSLEDFMGERIHSGGVLGGTAWTFAKLPPGMLDLLVIDEAGQYSLANTIAAGASANRLLLLGDPQQLPQVSQGTHPEPIDQSALSWISANHAVLSRDFGYFLAQSRRMHPGVCSVISTLAYEGQLDSHESVTGALLPPPEADVSPTIDIPHGAGVHAVAVAHTGRSTSSPEEAKVVGNIIESVMGSLWRNNTDDNSQALSMKDILVVTAYNDQRKCILKELNRRGYQGVPVGTVDKFQGQEGVISIVSMGASSPEDVPRGMEFLLNLNRLNVAVSRAKWASYVVYSPSLIDYLPATIEGLSRLGKFIELVGE